MAQSATRKIAYNTVVQIFGKFLQTVLAGMSVFILTRYLGPTGYGKFTIALVFLSFFSIIADLGLFTIIVRKISEKPKDTEVIVGNGLSLRTVASIAVMLVAIGVGFLMPYSHDVKIGIIIASLSLIFGLMNSSLVTVLQAKLRMDYSVISDVTGRLLSLAAVAVVAGLNWGYYAVVATAAVGTLFQFLVTNYFVRRMIRVRWRADKAVWKELFWKSIPLGISVALTFIYFRLDTLILSILKEPAEVGLYGAAYKVLEILLTMSGFFINAVFPIMAGYLAVADTRLKGLVQTSYDSLLMFSLPLAAGTIVLGGPIIRVVAGAEFNDAGLALQLLAPALIFSFTNALFGYMLVAKDKTKSLIWLSLGILVVNVALNFLTIPTWGFRAAAINTVVSEGLVTLVSGWLAYRAFGFFPRQRALPRTILATLVMAAAVYVAKPLTLAPATLIGMAVYAVAIYAFNGPGKDLVGQIRAKGSI